MAKKEIDKKALNAEISKAMMNDFERVGMGFVTYWKLIACAAVGLAVLIAAICWAASYQRSSAKNAREALSGARTADELAAALASYGSSPAAPGRPFPACRALSSGQEIRQGARGAEAGRRRQRPVYGRQYRNHRGVRAGAFGKLDDAAAKFAAAAGDTALPAPMRARGTVRRGAALRAAETARPRHRPPVGGRQPGRYAERHRHLG